VITGLVLAAGAGRRFGDEPKLLQELDGKPIIRCVVDALHAGGVGSVVVVVAPDHAAIAYALHGTDAHLIVNPEAASGLGTSLATGIAAMPAYASAALVTLGDIPRLPATVIAALRTRYRQDDVEIVVPEYRSVRGHPVLFARSVFPELRELAGDRGARTVIDRSPERVAVVEIDELPPADVDTVEDLARVRMRAHHTSTSTP